ncbi:MAG: rhomboid family intramembrane serine protease [Planctomycetes bacterium]|nr:rhomboid family intramembrane serine protease [Planctomycetota bacterium]
MRQAGTIQDAKQARLFADFLISQGITCQVDQAEGGFAVWIHDEAQLQRSRLELSEFLIDPTAELYREAQKEVDALRRKAKAQKQSKSKVVDLRQRWRPWTEGRFPITWLLILIGVGLSLGTRFGNSDWAEQWLYMTRWVSAPEGGIRYFGNLPEVREGQIWRLFTPALLQVGGWPHMIFNMWWIYMAGALIETRRGSWAMLGIALATAVISNLAQFMLDGPSFGGMSGIGFGLFGYIWMKSRFDPGAGIYAPPDLVVQFLVFLVVCMLGWLGSIANAAHVGGMVVGMAIAYVPVLWRKLG